MTCETCGTRSSLQSTELISKTACKNRKENGGWSYRKGQETADIDIIYRKHDLNDTEIHELTKERKST